MCLNNSEFLKYRLLRLYCRFKTPLVFGGFWHSECSSLQPSAWQARFSGLTTEMKTLRGCDTHSLGTQASTRPFWLGILSFYKRLARSQKPQLTWPEWLPKAAIRCSLRTCQPSRDPEQRQEAHTEFPPHYLAQPGLLRVLKSCAKNPPSFESCVLLILPAKNVCPWDCRPPFRNGVS